MSRYWQNVNFLVKTKYAKNSQIIPYLFSEGVPHDGVSIAPPTSGSNGFTMVFGPITIAPDGFLMVANHWSNDGMVTIHRFGPAVPNTKYNICHPEYQIHTHKYQNRASTTNTKYTLQNMKYLFPNTKFKPLNIR